MIIQLIIFSTFILSGNFTSKQPELQFETQYHSSFLCVAYYLSLVLRKVNTCPSFLNVVLFYVFCLRKIINRVLVYTINHTITLSFSTIPIFILSDAFLTEIYQFHLQIFKVHNAVIQLDKKYELITRNAVFQKYDCHVSVLDLRQM